MNYKELINRDRRTKVICLHGAVEYGISLKSLQEQTGDINLFDTLIVDISSPGGDVEEGLNIMTWLDELSSKHKYIITLVSANAYSIASLIMLAANEKLVSNYGEAMVHNPMIAELAYANADELEDYVDQLRCLESFMYNLYKEFSGIEFHLIKKLMDNETFLSPTELVEYGFMDGIIDMEKRSYVMTSVNNKRKINMLKTLNTLKRVVAKIENSPIVDQTYYDKSGGSIKIYQKDNAMYLVGDRTNVKEGEVSLSDGSILVIKDSLIIDIKKEEIKQEKKSDMKDGEFNEGDAPKEEPKKNPKEEEGDDDMEEEKEPSEGAPKKDEEKKDKKVKDTFESKVENKDFKIGDIVNYVKKDEADVKNVEAGEWKLEDGRTILTDSCGVIRYMSEIEESEKTSDKIEDVVNKENDDKHEEKLVEIENRLKELSDTIKALADSNEEANKKFSDLKEFEEMATEAIDVIAKNTTSNFRTSPKDKETKTFKGSIFQQLKQERGL